MRAFPHRDFRFLVLGWSSCQFRAFLVGFCVHAGLFPTGVFATQLIVGPERGPMSFPILKRVPGVPLILYCSRSFGTCVIILFYRLRFFSVFDHVTVCNCIASVCMSIVCTCNVRVYRSSSWDRHVPIMSMYPVALARSNVCLFVCLFVKLFIIVASAACSLFAQFS